MTGTSATPSVLQLPEVLPIFPLEGALLLPHGHLPLHIFEPRYRNMIEDALGQGRFIGMVQPRAPGGQSVTDETEVFAIGCCGRIVAFSETEDGRFLISLKGLCRFRTIEELPVRQGYRRVSPDFAPFSADFQALSDDGIDRKRMLSAAQTYLDVKQISCDWAAAEAAPTSALVNTFAMSCPLEAREKQALLEADTLPQRAELLVSFFTMAALENDSISSTSQH